MKFWKWIFSFFKPPVAKINGVEIHEIEEAILQQFPKEMRPFELAYMRTALNMNWDKSTKIRNRKLFLAGWNAAVFVKAKRFVGTEADLQKIENENRKLDAKGIARK